MVPRRGALAQGACAVCGVDVGGGAEKVAESSAFARARGGCAASVEWFASVALRLLYHAPLLMNLVR